jgi:beta-lactamase class A
MFRLASNTAPVSRRRLLAGLTASATPAVFGADVQTRHDSEILRLERSIGGRIGVWIMNTASREVWAHRGTERFPLCGQYKLLACAALLSRADEGKVDMQSTVSVHASQLLPMSPVTSQDAGARRLSLAQLCEAALTQNDDTAGNLILHRVGGPEGLTDFIRYQGDPTSRSDRPSPGVMDVAAGDPRDTTTPRAMGEHIWALLFGETLSVTSQRLLLAWLLANRTGNDRLRARLPRGWVVADKTAIGHNGSLNDVAVVWPTNHRPLIASVFVTDTNAPMEQRNAAVARIGSLLPGFIGRRGLA